MALDAAIGERGRVSIVTSEGELTLLQALQRQTQNVELEGASCAQLITAAAARTVVSERRNVVHHQPNAANGLAGFRGPTYYSATWSSCAASAQLLISKSAHDSDGHTTAIAKATLSDLLRRYEELVELAFNPLNFRLDEVEASWGEGGEKRKLSRAEEVAVAGPLDGAADAEINLAEGDDPNRPRRILFSCHGR